MKNLETAAGVMDRLFDPALKNKKEYPVDRKVKAEYPVVFLNRQWEKAVGSLLKDQCRAEKIERGILYVQTADSVLAQQLFMLKDEFLAKVNSVLEGKAKIKNVRFNAGYLSKKETRKKEEEKEAGPLFSPLPCPRCGGRKREGEKLCGICRRRLKEEEREKIDELLKSQPYLQYEEVDLILNGCDKLLFDEERDKLLLRYCEKVRQGSADEEEEQLAVLLLLGKRPAEITKSQWQNCLRHLRRKKDVPAPGF